MTTATINFDQPTLFREGRFSRDDVPPPRRDRDGSVTAPPRDAAAVTAPSHDRDRVAPAPKADAPRVAHAPRGGLTLDDVLSAAWDGLASHHSVTCPVCSGSMAPRYGSGAKPVGGRCGRCGSTLG